MSININETGFDVESVLPKGGSAQAQDVDVEVLEQTAEADGTTANSDGPAKKTKYARTKANQPSALFRDNNLDPELEAQLSAIMDSIELPDVGVPLAQDAASASVNAKPADTMSELGINSGLLVGSAREEITVKKKGKKAGTATKAPKKPRASKASTSKKSTAIDMETMLGLDEDAMEGATEEEELKAKYILTIQRYQNSPIFGPYLKQMGVKHTATIYSKYGLRTAAANWHC